VGPLGHTIAEAPVFADLDLDDAARRRREPPLIG
jgi:hypothetical protein